MSPLVSRPSIFLWILLSAFLVGPSLLSATWPWKDLVLVDEVNCGDAEDSHPFQDYPSGISEIRTVLGQNARHLPNDHGGVKYFAYRLGENKGLVAGKAYVLEVDYPEDAPRSIFVLNRGCETQRGFHTGATIGDALHPPYIFSNPESLALPLSGKYETFRMIFHLHDRFPVINQPRTDEYPRSLRPEDGFWVLIAQFRASDDPLSEGAAVSSIRLYEAPDLPASYAEINYPPEGLPRRYLFSREEMADMVVASNAVEKRGVQIDVDWFAYKAQLMRLLGFNTFSVDLLEFGHNQGWDSTPYGGNDWVYQAWNTARWENIVKMAAANDLYLLPYYEYSGSRGAAGLGYEKRALPLTRDDAYTEISWTEDARADLTDPDTFDDFRKMLDATVLRLKDEGNFVGVWLRPRSSQLPISFGPHALNRFSEEVDGGKSVSRADLRESRTLLDRYYSWWFEKRREFINQIRDYLRENEVNAEAVVLYTSDATEAGRNAITHPTALIAESPGTWSTVNHEVVSLEEALETRRHHTALTSPRMTYGGWEWHHADPLSDPWNYDDNEGGLLTFPFNRRYTIGDSAALNAFRTPSGLAMIRHYTLNEDTMSTDSRERVFGYFVSDVEPAGPFCMIAEAEAMANGDPRYLGYLSGHTFNRSFPEYVRAFNQAFLSLPAIESEVIEIADRDRVVVRRYASENHGDWYSVVNLNYETVTTTIRFPSSGKIVDAATDTVLAQETDSIELELHPCELRSLRLISQTKINDDSAETLSEVPLRITPLENDSSPHELALVSISAAHHGVAEIEGDAVRYTSHAGFVGEEELIATVSDGETSHESRIRIRIAPQFGREPREPLFKQNFEASRELGSYCTPTPHDHRSFNDLAPHDSNGGWWINAGGALEFSYLGGCEDNGAGFTRFFDHDLKDRVIEIQFDFTAYDVSGTSDLFRFQIGDFETVANYGSSEASERVLDTLTVRAQGTDAFRLYHERIPVGSILRSNEGSMRRITWIINPTEVTQQIQGPDESIHSLEPVSASFWIDANLIQKDQSLSGSAVEHLRGFRCYLPNCHDGTRLRFDNFSITALGDLKPFGYSRWSFQLGLAGSEAFPFEDPDHDRLVNLMEYAVGANPLEADLSIPFSLDVTDHRYELTYQRRRSDNLPTGSTADFILDGLRFNLEISSDLLTWQNASTLFKDPRTVHTSTHEEVTLTSLQTVEDHAPPQYIRLQVELAE